MIVHERFEEVMKKIRFTTEVKEEKPRRHGSTEREKKII